MLKSFKYLFLLFLVVELCGCATSMRVVAGHSLEINIHTSSDLNLNSQGNPSVLSTTFYQLTKSDLAAQSDLMGFATSNKKCLKHLILRPHHHYSIKLKLQDSTQFIGVIAKYNELTPENWQVIFPVKSKWGAGKINLYFNSNSIRAGE